MNISITVTIIIYVLTREFIGPGCAPVETAWIPKKQPSPLSTLPKDPINQIL